MFFGSAIVFLKNHCNKIRFYRLHKIEHFPFLNFLHFEDIFQRDLIEVLPHVVHLVIRLGEICLENQTKHTTEQTHMKSNWGFVAFSPCVEWECVMGYYKLRQALWYVCPQFLIGNIVHQHNICQIKQMPVFKYHSMQNSHFSQHKLAQRAEHTSWRCASFFLADRLRCFSNTVQYFSVSLSYFFLASYGIKMQTLSQLKQP